MKTTITIFFAIMIMAVIPERLLADSWLKSQPWSKTDVALEVMLLSFTALDWQQTRVIAANPNDYYETNELLGEHPSLDAVDSHFALCSLGHMAVAHFLPSKARKIWQGIWATVQMFYVQQNHSKGIKAKHRVYVSHTFNF